MKCTCQFISLYSQLKIAIMEIIRLKGTDKKLYTMVGPLVMDADVLKQNNGYPFKTSEEYTWYIAVEKKKVVGFFPFILKGKHRIYIDNYFIAEDNPDVFDVLLDAITNDYYEDLDITALVHKRHVDYFKRNHFQCIKDWKNYETMQYNPEMEVEE